MKTLSAALLCLACRAPASAQETPLPDEVQATFEAIRTSAVARRVDMVGSTDSKTVRRLQATHAKRSTSEKAWAELAERNEGSRTQWISAGLLAQLDAKANDRPHFAQRVLGLILARQLAALWCVSPVDVAETEAVRVFNGAGLPGGALNDEELQAAVDLLTESRGLKIECRKAFLDIGPMNCGFVPSWKVRARYGTQARQVRRYRQAVDALAKAAEKSGMTAALSQ
jgi:hypothetical protein